MSRPSLKADTTAATTGFGSDGSGYVYTDPIHYSAASNIFVNATLFQIYSDYFYSTIIPIYFPPIFPTAMPVTSENQLNASDVSLDILYSCTDVVLKSAIEFIIVILVADWAFISTFLTIIVIAGK
jgi:hypothetical protein